MIDEQSALVLAVQLVALCSIAGSLLLYLLCKAKATSSSFSLEIRGAGSGRSILITSCENSLGLQLALYFTQLGFRVFAGVKNSSPEQSDAAQILKAKLKALENRGEFVGTLILLSLDVTREDSLHEAVDTIRRHLPVGENGLWGLINTAGVVVKGKLEAQESCHWESMFKVNVVGTLRTARAFLPILKATKGRLVTIGLSGECHNGTGVVAYTAARHAVAGASTALANEVSHLGIRVITINTGNFTADALYRHIKVRNNSVATEEGATGQEIFQKYKVNCLPVYALQAIEEALLCETPKHTYDLLPPGGLTNYLAAITERFNHANKHKAVIESV